jgi:hypothetical protein
MPLPNYGPDLTGLDFDSFTYFIRPSEKEVKNWDEVPETIKNTFNRLGIPDSFEARNYTVDLLRALKIAAWSTTYTDGVATPADTDKKQVWGVNGYSKNTDDIKTSTVGGEGNWDAHLYLNDARGFTTGAGGENEAIPDEEDERQKELIDLLDMKIFSEDEFDEYLREAGFSDIICFSKSGPDSLNRELVTGWLCVIARK